MSLRLKAVFATIVILTTGLLAITAQAQQAAPNPRIALVIGNATYRDVALATTANDAGLVAQTLQAAGFDVVGARDLDGQSLRTALRDFLQKAAAAGPDMQAFVYLSGRAVQYNGDNYFVPVDAQINRDADVPIEAIRIADFSHALAATPGRARIIVLDAARANPYATQGSPLAPGLALVDPERGELMAFNAAPGTLAGDEEGPYGVYGKTLSGAIRQGGVDIVQAFDQTRVSVNAETQGALLPWSASTLDGPFYVFERAADAPSPALSFAQTEHRPISSFPAADAYAAAVERDTLKGYREFLAAYPNSDQARRVRAILAVRREAAYWRRTVGADTPRAYWTYLHTYPKGPHIPDARRRLAMLSAEFQPPPDFRPEAFADLPPPPPDELVYDDRPIYAFDDFGPPPPPPPVQYGYVEDDGWRDLPPPPPPAEIGLLPVLGVALPIAIGAVAYQHGFHHDGVAPRGEPRLRQPPFAPPPLPANVRPVAPPAPVAVAAAPAANAAVVKPLRPLGGRRGQAGGQPPSGAAPGKPAGAPSAPAPASPTNSAGTAAPVAPVRAPKPLPVPPAPGSPPAAALPVATPKPQGNGAAPANAAKPGAPIVPGGKPLPTPPAAVAAPNAPPVPGGKPLPVVPAPSAAGPPVAPVATKPAGKAPLPLPTPPGAAVAPIAPVVPGAKPLPVVPSPSAAGPAAAPVATKPAGKAAAPAAGAAVAPVGKPLAPTASPTATKALTAPAASPVQARKPPPPAAPASNPAPKPNVATQPPVAAPRAAVPPPAVHAPAPAALAPAAPRPAPAAMRVPAAPVAAPPPAPHLAPPAVRAPSAPAPAPPVVHAPPPPAAALPPALRQPPPAVRVQPPVGQPQACGRPGLPPCPK
jgi:uncharacterized caspase-like protein